MDEWKNVEAVKYRSYECGFCGNKVGPNLGYRNNDTSHYILICPSCNTPTYFYQQTEYKRIQTPAPLIGNDVSNVSDTDIESLYNEARTCTGNNAFTAAVLACRKILMHIAVDKGAPTNKSFMEYVQYLSDNSYVPPDAKDWVDHIRTKGNEANHEIVLMEKADAIDLINFIEMLLKIIYEFPSRLPKPPEPES